MSKAALLEGYILLHNADKQAHCEGHWRRVIEALQTTNPKLVAEIEKKTFHLAGERLQTVTQRETV